MSDDDDVFGLTREQDHVRALRATFRGVEERMESDWIPEMRRILGLGVDALPLLWDADFLYGPQDGRGQIRTCCARSM